MSDSPKTRIYRLTHYRNLPFIFRNGLHCSNCAVNHPGFVSIGFQTLIDSRGTTPVKVDPRGVLNDYVPFYFCPRSPMLFMIHKGRVLEYTGTQQELVYLVSNVEAVDAAGIPYVFTDRHAKLGYAEHYNKLDELSKLDWESIENERWGQQYGVAVKEKKQAEFLVFQTLPLNLIKGIVCHNQQVHQVIDGMMSEAEVSLPVVCKPNFYY